MSNINIDIKNAKSIVYLPIAKNIDYVTNRLYNEEFSPEQIVENASLKIGNIEINNDFLKKVLSSNRLKINHEPSDKLINNLMVNQSIIEHRKLFLVKNNSPTSKPSFLTKKAIEGNIQVAGQASEPIFVKIFNDEEIEGIFKKSHQSIEENQKNKPEALSDKTIKSLLDEKRIEIQNKRQKISNIGIGMTSGMVDLGKLVKYFDFKSSDFGKVWRDVGLKLADDLTNSLISQTVSNVKSMKDEFLKRLREGPKPDSYDGNQENIEPTKDTEAKTSNKSTQEAAVDGVMKQRSFLGDLMASADFQSNYYNVFIDLSKDNDKDIDFEDEPLKIDNRYFLATRLKGVDIPQLTRETFETKFLNTSIKRITPKVNVTRTATLTFDEDDNFFVSSNFEHLSGVHSWKTLETDNKNLASIFNTKYAQIRVVHRLVGTTFYNLTDSSIPRQPTISPKVIEYTFKDVAFLGKTNGYEFKRGDASQSTVSIKFVFRSVYVKNSTDDLKDNFNPFESLQKYLKKS